MLVLIYFIRRGTDSKIEWSFYDQFSAANLAGFPLTNALGENLPSRH